MILRQVNNSAWRSVVASTSPMSTSGAMAACLRPGECGGPGRVRGLGGLRPRPVPHRTQQSCRSRVAAGCCGPQHRFQQAGVSLPLVATPSGEEAHHYWDSRQTVWGRYLRASPNRKGSPMLLARHAVAATALVVVAIALVGCSASLSPKATSAAAETKPTATAPAIDPGPVDLTAEEAAQRYLDIVCPVNWRPAR